MKEQNSKKETAMTEKNSNFKHMRMMAICCGLPILGFMAIAMLGINMPGLETLFALICPIGMVAMMWMMRKNHKGSNESCCQSGDKDSETVSDNGPGQEVIAKY